MRRVLWGLYSKWTTEGLIYRSLLWGAFVWVRERVHVAQPRPPQGGTGAVRPLSIALPHAVSPPRDSGTLPPRPPPTTIPSSGTPVLRRVMAPSVPMSPAVAAELVGLGEDLDIVGTLLGSDDSD